MNNCHKGVRVLLASSTSTLQHDTGEKIYTDNGIGIDFVKLLCRTGGVQADVSHLQTQVPYKQASYHMGEDILPLTDERRI
jgi:hypothetical protein